MRARSGDMVVSLGLMPRRATYARQPKGYLRPGQLSFDPGRLGEAVPSNEPLGNLRPPYAELRGWALR